MLFTPEMLAQLKAELANCPDSHPAIPHYQDEIEVAEKIMRGELDVYAALEEDGLHNAQLITSLEQLRQYAKDNICCMAFAIPHGEQFDPVAAYAQEGSAIELGDFDLYGVEAGIVLAYMLPREAGAPGPYGGLFDH